MSISPKNPPVPPPPAPPASASRGGRKTGTKFCCGCSCAALLLFGLLVGWVLWIVAAMGVAPIPLFSRLAYRVPEPIRVTEAETALKMPFDPAKLDALQDFKLKEGEEPTPEQLEQFEQLFDEQALQDLFAQLDTLGGSLTSNRFRFEITEGMLTATLRQAAAVAPKETSADAPSLFDLSRAQIAISESRGFEVFLPLANNAERSALRVYLLARATEDGRLDLDIRDLWLGNFHFPKWFTEPFNQGLFRKAVAALSPELAKYAILERLEIKDGSVTLEGELTSAFREL